ncbi:oligosaccharide flippase family protein, partial [Candidatus Woesebacteria bacterium]|nr:oligosaccharide flippase family protein [Candidatus Woesebacteria bacterium]
MKQVRLLLSSEGLRSSLLMMGGNVFAQGLSGIAIIILSRVIGPEQFGIFSTGFSLALIAASIVDLGLTAAQQQAIPRADSPEKRNTIFGTVIALKVLLSLLIIVIALPLAPILGSYLHFSSASLLFWLIVANVGSIFFNQLASMLLSVKRVGQTVLINTIQASSKLILALLVSFLGWRSGTGILLSYIALPLVLLPFSRMLLPKWYRFSTTFNAKSWLEMRSMALNN